MSNKREKTKKVKNDYKLSSSKITSTKKKKMTFSNSKLDVNDMILKFEGIYN